MATTRLKKIPVEIYFLAACLLISMHLAWNMEVEPIGELGNGTRWAVLVAGSEGYPDYRSQADVCHAYQILLKGGLKEENIIVFMYDDIATHKDNPCAGGIYNEIDGDDVYASVPKDYTGENATAYNLFAVLLGLKNKVRGGSGKVVDSGPEDRIFLYYSDHVMPHMPIIEASTFIKILEKKHAMRTYKSMLIYFEACQSGNIFLTLVEDLNIFVLTASGTNDSSYGTHCFPKIETCLGDIFSNAWMEYSETHNLHKVSIGQQVEQVKKRMTSNVTEFGSKEIKKHRVSLYLGNPLETVIKYPKVINLHANPISSGKKTDDLLELVYPISQREVGVMLAWVRYKMSSGQERDNALEKIRKILIERARANFIVQMIGVLLFGSEHAHSILYADRDPSLSMVDDDECFASMIEIFRKHCGMVNLYEGKFTLAFKNICNRLVGKQEFEEACIDSCRKTNKDYSF